MGTYDEMDASEIEAVDMSVCERPKADKPTMCLLYCPDGSNLFVVVRGYNAALDAAGTCQEVA